MVNDYDVRAAVGLILNSHEEILLQKKDRGYIWHPNMWCFFGGQINEKEEPIDAFRRETEEELKIKLENIRFLKNHPFKDTSTDGRSREGILYVFEADFTGEIKDISFREGCGFAFFGQEEISQLPIVGHNKYVILEYYRSRKH